MHITGDFSGLHSHLMLNAKEQWYLKPEVLVLSSTMPIQTVYVGQLSILVIILSYKSFSNVVPYNNFSAHNGHRFRTFKCTKSLVKYIAINDTKILDYTSMEGDFSGLLIHLTRPMIAMET